MNGGTFNGATVKSVLETGVCLQDLFPREELSEIITKFGLSVVGHFGWRSSSNDVVEWFTHP